MARPPKEKHLLLNVALRIMLTAAQKAEIEAAARHDSADVSAWVRMVLMQAARDRTGKRPKRANTK
jgi:hypothetical protein